MKKVAALIAVMLASGVSATACGSGSGSGSSSGGTATDAATAAATTAMATAMAPAAAAKIKLPIPLAKLPSQKVAAGSVSNGATLFAANCESCHGAGGKNGQVGPTLAGAGLKAGQVAYMIRHPAAVDKNSSMPALTLTDKELADISAYVASLK